MDVANRRCRQSACPQDASKLTLDQGHLRTFHGNVGAIAHGNADIGGSQRRCVVDAIARHGHACAGALQIMHHARLVRR